MPPPSKPEEEEEKIEPDVPDESVLDVSNKSWELSLFQSPPPPSDSIYIYRSSFHLVPSAVCRLERDPPAGGRRPGTPREAAGQVLPAGGRGVPAGKAGVLEGAGNMQGPAEAVGVLDAGGRRRAQVPHQAFSIRYLPPEIGCLKKLEELIFPSIS